MTARKSSLAISVLVTTVGLTTDCSKKDAEKTGDQAVTDSMSAVTMFERESYIKDVRQLTFEGQNPVTHVSGIVPVFFGTPLRGFRAGGSSGCTKTTPVLCKMRGSNIL